MPDLIPDTTTSAPTGKRKPSRRANTAERRATHNAVERQRRETLNGRFLDLAGLLPNLSQIRRPSKSAIVNSSIAHIHASRRHRLIAARELRMLKLEADALRRELNEWRDRSGLPRVEEPVRGDGFGLVLSGEVEVILPNIDDEEGVEEEQGEDDMHARSGSGTISSSDDADDLAQAAAVALLKSSGPVTPPTSSSPPNPFAYNIPQNSQPLINHTRSQSVSRGPQSHLTQMLRQHPQVPHPMHGGPMIASHPSTLSYEDPAMASVYDSHPLFSHHGNAAQYGLSGGAGYGGATQLPPHILAQLAAEMENKTSAGWYNNMNQFTPPSSSGGGSPVNSPFGNGGYQQPQRRVYANDGRGSVMSMERERSASMGSRESPVGNYELMGGVNVPRWMGDEGMDNSMRGSAQGYAMMM